MSTVELVREVGPPEKRMEAHILTVPEYVIVFRLHLEEFVSVRLKVIRGSKPDYEEKRSLQSLYLHKLYGD